MALEREDDLLSEWLKRTVAAEKEIADPLPPHPPILQSTSQLEANLVASLESLASRNSVAISENIVWSYVNQPYPLSDEDEEGDVSNYAIRLGWRSVGAAAILLSILGLS